MAGLQKQEEYNWKDSNLALFGSDVEKQVKLESAQSEPAWNNSGEFYDIRFSERKQIIST